MAPVRSAMLRTTVVAAMTVAAALWARFATEETRVAWLTLGVGLGALWAERNRPIRERLFESLAIAGLMTLLFLTARRLGWVAA